MESPRVGSAPSASAGARAHRPKRASGKRGRTRLLTGLTRAVTALALSVLSCGSPESLGMGALSVVGAGVINDPSNKSLRFDLLSYGLSQFCVEMKRRGAPIKLQDHQPVMGRFFSDACQSQIIDREDRQSVVVRYAGTGFAWTNVSGRIGFSSQGFIEYAADFRMHGESLYVYFRPRNVGAQSFETLLIENSLARVGLGLPGVNANAVGSDIIASQLRRGFTVIRHSSRGDTEFATGLVPAGQRPFRPFAVSNSERLTLDNDRTEIQVGQQDFVLGLHVAEDDQRIVVTVRLDGARAIDVFLLREGDARQMVQSYVRTTGPSALRAAPVLDAQALSTQPTRLELNVPPGTYALLFDHAVGPGRSNPPPSEPPAKVDYLVQIGAR